MKKRRVRIFNFKEDKQEKEICRNIFKTFLKIEKKRFAEVKFDFTRYGTANKKNKANAIAIKIHDFIIDRCSGHSNNPQYVLEDYLNSIFEAAYGSPDFYHFTPNSWSIGKFGEFIYKEEQAEGMPYFRKIQEKDCNKSVSHFDQDDSWMIDKETGYIFSDSCELKEIR